jgi:serine/threonine protein kinase
MFLFIRLYCSSVWAASHRIVRHFLDSFFDLFVVAGRQKLINNDTPNKIAADAENGDNSPAAPVTDCFTYTTRLQPQSDLQMIGVGASGQVYKVDDHIVLKTSRVFEPPTSDSSSQAQWLYASDTLFHYNLMKNERTVSRLLEKWPHPNVVEVVDVHHDEGIYLRKYLSLSEIEIPAQPGRILWYQNIIRGLLHIHNFGIAHSDLRIDNILFDQLGQPLLCDFSASSPFGQPNLAQPRPGLPFPINGPSEIISDATDRFAMGSLIFQMEHGAKPELSVDERGTLILPEVQTENDDLDTIIRKAWLGQYSSTTQILKHLESLYNGATQDTGYPRTERVSIESLKHRIKDWRRCRQNQFGKPCKHGMLSFSFLTYLPRLCSPRVANGRPVARLCRLLWLG